MVHWAVQLSWFAWMNALCNLLRKKSREVAASLPGQFLSRHCFTLHITMEVEPRTAKQYKCHHCCSCKNYWGKGMEGAVVVFLCVVFWLTSRWKKCVLGHPTAWATSYCLLPDTFWLWASKNDFKAGGVKFTNSLHSTVKKVPFTRSKAAKGLKRCQAKVKGVNNPAWTAQQCSVSLTRVSMPCFTKTKTCTSGYCAHET